MTKIVISLFTFCAMICSSFILHMHQTSDTVRHVVVFKYKEGTPQSKIDQVNASFGELQNKIPGITDFEYGINDSPEGKDQGFSHVYLLTFEDAEARNTYLPHPEHKKFGEMLGSLNILEDVFVVDYSPKE